MRAPGSLNNLLYPLKKRWYVVAICMLIACLVATRYLYMVTPEYQASATLKIEDPDQGNESSNLYRDFDVFKQSQKVATEVEVLKSRSLFDKALATLDFNVEYYLHDDLRTEEIYHGAPFRADFSYTSSAFTHQDYNFEYTGGDHFRLKFDRDGIDHQLEGTFEKPLNDNGVTLTLHKDPLVYKYKGSPYLSKSWSFSIYSPNGLSTKYMNRNYQVRAVDKDVNIIKVYYTHPVPEKAVRLVNAIAKTYIEEGIEDKQGFAGNTVDFINKQLALVGKELDDARNAIKNYRIRNDIVNIPQETEVTYKTLGELEIMRTDNEVQTAVLEHMSDYLRHSRPGDPASPEFATVQDGMFSDAVSRLNNKIQERSELLRRFTPENDKIKNADNEIAAIKAFLVQGVNNTRRKLFLKQDELANEIGTQKASFKGLPEKESTLQELNRNYFLYEKIYNFLIEKRTEALITRQVTVSFNKILESSVLPIEQVFPKPSMVWAIALFLGLVVGIVMAYVRHYFNPAVNGPEDIHPESNIPVIGQIGKLFRDQSMYHPFTALTTRILMNRPDDQNMVLTVTSTRKGEGKSFIATQLARTFAAMDKKVIVIDLNTYHPSLAAWFDLRGTQGLKDIYYKNCTVQDAIQITSIPNLDVITAGDGEQPIGHLAATSKTRMMLDELKRQYDVVIIDAPEAGTYTDAIPYMKWSDMNLYIVNTDGAHNELIANAEMVKEEYRLQEVYFVLNGMTEKRNHTGYIKPFKHLKHKKAFPQLTSLFAW